MSSVSPARQVSAWRRALQDALDDLRRIELMVTKSGGCIRSRVIAVPAMLRTRLVIHFAVVMRVLSRLEKFLNQIDSIVEEIIVCLANIDVEFTFQFRSQLGPVSFEDVAQVVVLFPISSDRMIDLAG